MLIVGGTLHGAQPAPEEPHDASWAATTAEIARLANEGERDSALRAGEAALDRARTEFGSDDPRTAEMLTLLAEVHMVRGEWGTAERMLLDGMAIRDRVLPELHWARAESRNLLAGVYAKTGRFDDAERAHRWAAQQATVAAEAGLVGPSAPRWVDIPTALNLLARSAHEHERKDLVFRLHAEMIDAVEKWGQGDPLLTLNVLDTYGAAFEARGDLENARRAANVMRHESDRLADDEWRAKARFDIGRLQWLANEDDAGSSQFLAAWSLAQRAFGKDDPRRVAYTSHAATAATATSGGHRDAEVERWLRDALRIAEIAPGQVEDLDLARCQDALADLLARTGRHAEALPLRRAVASLYRSIYGDASWSVANALTAVGTTLAEIDEIHLARASYSDAYDVLRRSGELEGWLDAYILHLWLGLDLGAGDLVGASERFALLIALRARAGATEEQAELARRELAALHLAAGRGPPSAIVEVAAPSVTLAEDFMTKTLIDMIDRAERQAGAADDLGAAARLAVIAELSLSDGQLDRAAKAYEAVLAIHMRDQGANHSRTSAIAQRLVVIHQLAGRATTEDEVLMRIGAKKL